MARELVECYCDKNLLKGATVVELWKSWKLTGMSGYPSPVLSWPALYVMSEWSMVNDIVFDAFAITNLGAKLHILFCRPSAKEVSDK